MAMSIKVVEKNVLFISLPLQFLAPSLTVHLSWSIPWLLSVRLWSVGVAARLVGGAGARRARERQENHIHVEGSGHGGGRGGSGVFRKFHQALSMLAQPHISI